MTDEKQSAHDMCKSHAARSERDIYRVCPSKLSKRELEDLYFALVDNNMELKKTVNVQREQIKTLSTKVQRMNSRPIKDHKECCNCKAVMNEQKDMIADLKKGNERLSDRIRVLNMRLCSAKQFLKKGTMQALKCPKCNTSAISVKNSSTSALNINSRTNEDTVRSATASCQYINDDVAQTSSPVTEVITMKDEQAEERCDQNKCRTVMGELKQRISDLQQELSHTHEEYSNRTQRLEAEMSEMRGEAGAASQRRREAADLLQRLRTCEAKCEQLTVQLRIESSRAAELEMRAKAAEMSSDIANAIEKHLNSLNIKREEPIKPNIEVPPSNITLSNVDESSMYHCQFQLMVPNNSVASQTDRVADISADKINRMSDDSGYHDAHRSDDSTQKTHSSTEENSRRDDAIMKQIADLQAQLNSLKQSFGENVRESQETEEGCLSISKDTNSVSKDSNVKPRRKSYCERLSTSSKRNEANCERLSPQDDDYLIRTNRLNSTRSAHEWCTEFEKMDAESTIDYENRPSIVGSIKDRSRRNSMFVEGRDDDLDYQESLMNDNMCELNRIKKQSISERIKEIDDIQKIHRQSDERLEDKDEPINIGTSSDDFNFAKETITRVSGKSLTESIYEKSDSTLEIKVNESFHKPVTESFGNIKDSVTNMLRKGNKMSSTLKVDEDVGDNKLVSTGVDPIEAERVKNDIVDTAVGPDVRREESASNQTHLDICEQSVRICTCPISARRGVAVFRSCSGTLRFTTTPSKSKFRKCACADKFIDIEEAGPSAYSPVRRTSTPTGETFVLKGSAQVGAGSPGATHCDISSLTDIASEREVISPNILSPGEDKGTCTQSEITPRSDYASLSEGEIPTHDRRQSIGETQSPEEDTMNIRRNTSTSEKMEEALRAISDELSRCRHLLQAHTSQESTRRGSMDASSMTERVGALALKKVAANQRIRAATPKCVFTLHVGTVILADQAVVRARHSALALGWRFYDQPPSLTHQLAGRVMHFDFSVEYDIRLTSHFLDYLKQEEMPIIICELEKQDAPFASCTLPLRDALLHTNRRVDMSLALMGGPGMSRQEAAGAGAGAGGALGASEAGVLDVWCMLRVPPDLMPALGDAVSQTLASLHHQASSLERILDADHTDFHLAQDLDLRRFSKGQQAAETKSSFDSENIYDIMNTKKWRRASALKQTEGCRKKSVTILPKPSRRPSPEDNAKLSDDKSQTLDITILWLALNEECRAMSDPNVKRLYVAYNFLGKCGADMETPSSLPKPRSFTEKCHFNFRKSFMINECDVVVLSHMARCRQDNTTSIDPKDCVVFTIISEPPEDPLGLDNCEDIGYAYLYLGDALAGGGDSHTQVLAVRGARRAGRGAGGAACGRLAVRVHGAGLLRAALSRPAPSA